MFVIIYTCVQCVDLDARIIGQQMTLRLVLELSWKLLK